MTTFKKKLHAQISIDLVEAALQQRQFLQLVDEYPSLYAGPHVQNAIRRCVRLLFIILTLTHLNKGRDKTHFRALCIFPMTVACLSSCAVVVIEI